MTIKPMTRGQAKFWLILAVINTLIHFLPPISIWHIVIALLLDAWAYSTFAKTK